EHRKKHKPTRLGTGMVLSLYLLGGPKNGRPHLGTARLVCRTRDRDRPRDLPSNDRPSDRYQRPTALRPRRHMRRLRVSSPHVSKGFHDVTKALTYVRATDTGPLL